MSLSTAEQIASAQKANLATLLGLVTKVTDGVAKLTELNLETTRSVLTEMQDNVLKALSAKEPAEWIGQQAAPAALIPERVQSYSRQVFEIASEMQAEFARVAQAQFEVATRLDPAFAILRFGILPSSMIPMGSRS